MLACFSRLPPHRRSPLRLQLATMLQLKPENVRCIYVEGAGCYGRNGSDDCSSEAALISKEIGRPVRLQWMRQDEHGWDPKGPPVLLDYRAGLDAEGRITAWEAEVFMPERPMRRSGATLLAATLADLPKFGPPDAPLHNIGLGIPYSLPNNKLTAHWLVDTPLPAAWIRAPGRMQNTFGNESFLDEIAAAAGVDPFEIRARHLKDPRGLELLERLRRFAKWESRGTKPRDAGHVARGRGVSYAKYELVRTYVGIVADVPEVVVDLLDRPNDVPWGAGEPTTPVVPSAIANGVFDATGSRLRSVPFRPETVLAAFSAMPR